jgi:hypothetical protein
MMDSPPHTTDPVAKAIAMLNMLSAEVRQQVLDRMDPEMRQRIQDRVDSTPASGRPHGDFSSDVERSRLVRETAERMQQRQMSRADMLAHQLDPSRATGTAALDQPSAPLDPLDQLSTIHPAAIARAMQGERAEVWALVLDRMQDRARRALLAYLDTAGQTSIDDARSRQQELPIQLRATIERAVARTVVPMALREQAYLLGTSTPHLTGAGHGTAV